MMTFSTKTCKLHFVTSAESINAEESPYSHNHKRSLDRQPYAPRLFDVTLYPDKANPTALVPHWIVKCMALSEAY